MINKKNKVFVSMIKNNSNNHFFETILDINYIYLFFSIIHKIHYSDSAFTIFPSYLNISLNFLTLEIDTINTRFVE